MRAITLQGDEGKEHVAEPGSRPKPWLCGNGPTIKAPAKRTRAGKISGESGIWPGDLAKRGRAVAPRSHPPTVNRKAPTADQAAERTQGHERQMLDLLNKLRPRYTVQGFRSSFADWAAEHDCPRELRELALSHSVGNAVAQAYRRSKRVNSRREMMSAWSDFALERRAFQ